MNSAQDIICSTKGVSLSQTIKACHLSICQLCVSQQTQQSKRTLITTAVTERSEQK